MTLVIIVNEKTKRKKKRKWRSNICKSVSRSYRLAQTFPSDCSTKVTYTIKIVYKQRLRCVRASPWYTDIVWRYWDFPQNYMYYSTSNLESALHFFSLRSNSLLAGFFFIPVVISCCRTVVQR